MTACKFQRVLLTGASGMVGRNILEHPNASQFEWLTPARSELNLSRYQNCLEYLERHQPEVIVHCAGLVGGIQTNKDNRMNFLLANLDIGRNLVGAAHASGVRHLLNLSSSCTYPRDLDSTLSEELILTGPLEPTNEGYALAKIVIQRLCEYINQTDSKYRYKTLIPCNLYGRHDKFNLETSHLIGAAIFKIHSAILEGRDAVIIWGDGSARREFLYAGDFADAVIKALVDFDSLPEAVNVGVGRDHSVGDYYTACAEVMKFEGTFQYDLQRPVGMKRKLLSVEQQLKWGWSSSTTLHEGIEKSYSYFLESH